MTTTDSEANRLSALRRLRVFDEHSQAPFDRLVDLVARLFQVPSVGIHLLDDEYQWAPAFHGRDFTCDRDQSFCQFAIAQDEVLVVPDARQDPRFRDLALVQGDEPVLFYAGAPLITRDGYRVGTLCVMDAQPRAPLTGDQKQLLQELAGVVIETMELRVDQHRTREALERATELDPITGLRNRSSLLRALLHRQIQYNDDGEVGVLKLRLDRMARVHGGLGEDCRNEVLRETGRRLERAISDEELVSRDDGDTFVIGWCRGAAHPGEPFASIQEWGDTRSGQIQAAMDRPYTLAQETVQLTASIGLAWASEPYEALESAHTAAGTAQVAGGNRTMWYADTLTHSLRQEISVETRLRQAVAAEEFKVVYQPIVDIDQGGRPVGAEALLRWPGQEMPAASPGFFIPLAEQIGLMHALGRWVFRRACRDQLRLARAGHPIWLSINLSPVELTVSDLAEELAQIAQQAGADTRDLKLEITEGSLAQDFDEVAHILHTLKAKGFQLSLDDFGTGFSSLTRIVRLPFDSIKIDRGFVSDCPHGPGTAVVSAISELAANLRMSPIAEGVETEAHEHSLRRERIHLGQGFLYSAGIDIDAFEALLHEQSARHTADAIPAYAGRGEGGPSAHAD